VLNMSVKSPACPRVNVFVEALNVTLGNFVPVIMNRDAFAMDHLTIE
jgi:hypothetical protein